jgi:hypothetical protein
MKTVDSPTRLDSPWREKKISVIRIAVRWERFEAISLTDLNG